MKAFVIDPRTKVITAVNLVSANKLASGARVSFLAREDLERVIAQHNGHDMGNMIGEQIDNTHAVWTDAHELIRGGVPLMMVSGFHVIGGCAVLTGVDENAAPLDARLSLPIVQDLVRFTNYITSADAGEMLQTVDSMIEGLRIHYVEPPKNGKPN